MESHVNKYKDWEVLVKKTVAFKAKAALQPILYIREIDQHCPQRNQLAYTTTAKSQGSPMKDSRSKDHKPKSFGPVVGSGLGPQRIDTKSSTKSKMRKYGLNKKSDTPASGTNTTEAETGQKSKKQKRDNWRSSKKDISGITCYHSENKDHYINKCPETPKAKN